MGSCIAEAGFRWGVNEPIVNVIVDMGVTVQR